MLEGSLKNGSESVCPCMIFLSSHVEKLLYVCPMPPRALRHRDLRNASNSFTAPQQPMKFAKYWKCMEMIHGLAVPCEDLSITVLRFRDSDFVLQWRAMISILVTPSAPFNHPNKRKTYSPLPVP